MSPSVHQMFNISVIAARLSLSSSLNNSMGTSSGPVAFCFFRLFTCEVTSSCDMSHVLYGRSGIGSLVVRISANGVGMLFQMSAKCWANASAVLSVGIVFPVLSYLWYGCGLYSAFMFLIPIHLSLVSIFSLTDLMTYGFLSSFLLFLKSFVNCSFD